MKDILRKSGIAAMRIVPQSLCEKMIKLVIGLKTQSLNDQSAIGFLLTLDNYIYSLSGNQAIRYGQGVHTKHKHLNYHQFFKDRIPEGSKVLDIGCGYGALANSLSSVPNITLYGIDIDQKNVEKARKLFPKSNLVFQQGDVYKDLEDKHFDVVILSNVLEHLENRAQLLKTVFQKTSFNKILIRVPAYNRDWRVPLKQELGLEWRLDPTHFIEYTEETLRAELQAADLDVVFLSSQWGEFWVECKAK